MGRLQRRISRMAIGGTARGLWKGKRMLKNAQHSFRLLGILLCFAMIFPVVLTMAYSVLVLAATHPGEQTANYMPSDIDTYATINLRPGVQQGLCFKDILNEWWEYPGTKGIMEQFRDEVYQDVYDATGISIDVEANIVPWLGPEIAAGSRGQGFLGEPPEVVVFVGTTDNTASHNFFFDKFVPFVFERTDITEPNGNYNGIDTLTIEISAGNTAYFAFVDAGDDYIMASNSEALFYECLDLVAYGGSSLADTPRFQAAQASLPKPAFGDPPVEEERVAMVYFNSGAVWQQVAGQVEPGTPEAFAVDFFTPYIPEFAALSASFVDHGIKLDFYSPTPAGLDVPSLATTPLNAAGIIPGNAAAVYSINDINGIWQAARTFADGNWADLGTLSGRSDWPDSLESVLGSVESEYGINLDEDLFGWMNGECTVVQAPWGSGPTGPDTLLLLQVDDQALVEAKLEAIINAINAEIGQTVDPLELEQSLIGDVEVTFVTNSAIKASGLSPGYLFLDNFLVISFSKDALSSVVVTHSHPELSLAKTAEFKWITSRLQAGNAGIVYVNGSRLVDRLLSLMDANQRSGFEQYAAPFLDPLRSAGLSVDIGQDAIRGSLILHVERTDGTLVEGQVQLQGCLEHDGVTVDVGGQQTVSNALGCFSLSGVPAAENVTVTASAPAYLDAQRSGVTNRDGTRTSLGEVTLIAGDVSGDGLIDSADLAAISSAFNSSPPSAATADINRDAIVDAYDLVWIGKNFGKHGPTTWLADPGQGIISGFVYDTEGKPLPDARVHVSGIDVDHWSGCYSGSDGSYTVEGLPEGSYRVYAHAYGYFGEYYQDAVWETATPVTVTGAQETPNIDLTLQLGGSISGYVYDSSGINPLSNASVTVFDSTTHNQVSRVYTASDGSYRVAELPSGSYKVRSAQIGYLVEFYQEKTTLDTASPVEVTLGEETTDINFTLDLGGSISGYVRDSHGNPLSDVDIYVYGANTHNQIRSCRTASDGSYKTQGLGLPSGSYHVSAYRYAYIGEYYDGAATIDTATAITLTAPQTIDNINFTLELGGSISGTVRDSGGNPVSGAWITVYDSSGYPVGWGYTDNNGSYSIVGLRSGQYKVYASASGYTGEYYGDTAVWAEATLVLLTAPEETGSIDFTLSSSP